MTEKATIKHLDVYNEAPDFANLIWEICTSWDYFPQKTIGYQLVTAADSISANIAEGYGRYHFKENLKFCYYARGSLFEVEDWLKKAYSPNLISKAHKSKIEKFITEYPLKLNGYINYIKKQID